jgi:hypothetical protein
MGMVGMEVELPVGVGRRMWGPWILRRFGCLIRRRRRWRMFRGGTQLQDNNINGMLNELNRSISDLFTVQNY